MKANLMLIAVAAAAVAAGTPALAQMQSDSMKKGEMSSDKGMMSSGKDMKMSMADKKMMAKCNGMSHDMMMKNKGCMKMMKMHPDMMKGS